MGIAAPALATIVGLLGAVLGIWLTGLPHRARAVVLFGLLPELASEIGWRVTTLLFAIGYGALLLVNRFVYPVCPTCAHDHDHNADRKSTRLNSSHLVISYAVFCLKK